MNYSHPSERETGIVVCVQDSQPLRGLKAFAIFPNWPNLFRHESPFLFSPSHPPLPVASGFLARRMGTSAGMLLFQRVFRCGMAKAGRRGMLALCLAAEGTCFSTGLQSLGDLDFLPDFLYSW